MYPLIFAVIAIYYIVKGLVTKQQPTLPLEYPPIRGVYMAVPNYRKPKPLKYVV